MPRIRYHFGPSRSEKFARRLGLSIAVILLLLAIVEISVAMAR